MGKIIALCLVLVLALSIVGCSNKSTTFDFEKTSSISITLGSEKVVIEDEEFIQDITNNINSLEFEKSEKADGRIVCSYILDWLDENDNITASVFIVSPNGSQILLDGYHYNVKDEKNIDTNLISEMLDIAISSSSAPDTTN